MDLVIVLIIGLLLRKLYFHFRRQHDYQKILIAKTIFLSYCYLSFFILFQLEEHPVFIIPVIAMFFSLVSISITVFVHLAKKTIRNTKQNIKEIWNTLKLFWNLEIDIQIKANLIN